MKKINLIINLFFLLNIVSCQTDSIKEIAQKNFEEYFKKFKDAYPADKFEYTFSEYSELFEMRPYPEDMKYLSKLDSTNCNDKFYSLYAHKISLITEEDIRAEELPISPDLKKTYKKLKKLALSSELSNEHNLENEISLARKMRELMKKEKPPLTGYGQTVLSHSENSKGVVNESTIFIEYDLDYNVVGMGTLK
jgi:hypothetical protein